jgi:hypothetical protein
MKKQYVILYLVLITFSTPSFAKRQWEMAAHLSSYNNYALLSVSDNHELSERIKFDYKTNLNLFYNNDNTVLLDIFNTKVSELPMLEIGKASLEIELLKTLLFFKFGIDLPSHRGPSTLDPWLLNIAYNGPVNYMAPFDPPDYLSFPMAEFRLSLGNHTFTADVRSSGRSKFPFNSSTDARPKAVPYAAIAYQFKKQNPTNYLRLIEAGSSSFIGHTPDPSLLQGLHAVWPRTRTFSAYLSLLSRQGTGLIVMTRYRRIERNANDLLEYLAYISQDVPLFQDTTIAFGTKGFTWLEDINRIQNQNTLEINPQLLTKTCIFGSLETQVNQINLYARATRDISLDAGYYQAGLKIQDINTYIPIGKGYSIDINTAYQHGPGIWGEDSFTYGFAFTKKF